MDPNGKSSGISHQIERRPVDAGRKPHSYATCKSYDLCLVISPLLFCVIISNEFYLTKQVMITKWTLDDTLLQ